MYEGKRCAVALAWVAAAALSACGDDSGTQDAGDVEDRPDLGEVDAPEADVPDGDGEEADADPADEAAGDVDEDADGICPDCGAIRIYVAGDDSEKTFTDGLAGQTPFDYFIGVSSFEVLRRADDPAPVPCFDYGADTFSIDLQTDNLVGRCATSSFPLDTYTHGRVKVDWISYRVAGDVHTAAATLSTTFRIFKAFSACDYEEQHYAAGEGWVGYDIGGIAGRIPYVFPEPPALAGVSLVTDGDATWMVFPFTHPFVIGADDTAEHWSRMFWEIYESFRWTDVRLDGYAAGRWDVAPAGTTETPEMFGVSGFHIESSAD